MIDSGKVVAVGKGSDAAVTGLVYLCEGVAWTAEVAAALAQFEPGVPGKVYRKRVACPVNGDGYWYHRQEVLNSAGVVCGSIARNDLPSGEL